MKFSKVLLAAFLGTLIAMVATFFIKVGVVSSMISGLSAETETISKPQANSVLYMKLDYAISDRTTDNPFGSINFNSMETKDMTGLNVILLNIEQAKTDPNIKGIYMELSSIPTSTATLQEIRDKLIEFKESGKFIVTYGESYSQSAYYMASIADKIYINPEGALDLHGMASQITFYKHLLDKLDIEMQIVRGPNNRFKSAVEPYFLDKMSEANREQMEKLLGTVWGQILSGISQSRNISVEQLNDIADNLETYFDAKKALEYGLVDNLYYKDQVLEELKGLTGSNKDINAISNAKYAKSYKDKCTSKNEVAIIYATGQIFDGKGNPNQAIYSENLSKTIRKAREDENVKAVVLRVNSPGGSAIASQQIWHAIEQLKAKKPVVVSMGGLAASGGYMMSAGANYIFAEPTTITGSIGIFGTIPNVAKLRDKVGLDIDGLSTNKHSALENNIIFKGMNPEERAMMQAMIERGYDLFTSRCAEGRHVSQDYIKSIGVFGTVPNLQGFLNDKVGLTFDAAKTNKNADFGTLTQPLTEFQYSKLQEMVVKTYNDFTGRVAEGRGLTQTYVDSIGQGRVWAGADAIEIGLVDKLGDMEDAIAYAVEKAKLGNDFKVTEWPKQKDFFTRMMESMNESDKLDAAMKQKMGVYYDYLQGLDNLQKNTGIQARLPFDMIIE